MLFVFLILIRAMPTDSMHRPLALIIEHHSINNYSHSQSEGISENLSLVDVGQLIIAIVELFEYLLLLIVKR